MKRERAQPRKTARSIRELARIITSLGDRVSATAVGKWTRHAEWPFGPAPWRVVDVLAWRARTLPPDPARTPGKSGAAGGAPSPLTQSKIAINVRRAQWIQRQIEVLDDKYMPRIDAEARMIETVKAFREALFTRLRPILTESDAVRDSIERAWNDAVDSMGAFEAVKPRGGVDA